MRLAEKRLEDDACLGAGIRVQSFANMGTVASVVCPRCRMVFEGVRRERWPDGTLYAGRQGSAVIPAHLPLPQAPAGRRHG